MHSCYIDGPAGKLFVSIYSPSSVTSASWVLLCPPFAEEMNKSRPMISLQARALADAGHNVVVVDLFATGDSQGEFAQAHWDIWVDDLLFMLDWIVEHKPESISLWALRSGCLLSLEVLQRLSSGVSPFICRLLLWQPVLDGQQFIKQFLRLKVAAAMMEGQKLTVAELMHKSAAGEMLEVAGYSLSPELIEPMSRIKLKESRLPSALLVSWFEVASNAEKPLTPVAKAAVATLQEQGIRVDIATVAGESFWATQEIAMAPNLIDATRGSLAGLVSQPGGETAQMIMVDALAQKSVDAPVETFSEQPVSFTCRGEQLAGVLHSVPEPAAEGVLLIVGGPQYRVGSHRQFVLLARHLAEAGIPVLRFDYRGMGDSSGELLGFEHISEDIAAAVDCFQSRVSDLQRVALWGLCDAATAAAFYAPTDSRISRLILLNPWAYSEQGEAKAFLKYYYLQRLFSRSFWKKVLSGKFNPGKSLGELSENVSKARSEDVPEVTEAKADSGPLGPRIYNGLSRFKGQVLLILSGKDLTASQFKDVVSGSAKLKKLLKQKRFTVCPMDEADHTFSSREFRDEVARKTLGWLQNK